MSHKKTENTAEPFYKAGIKVCRTMPGYTNNHQDRIAAGSREIARKYPLGVHVLKVLSLEKNQYSEGRLTVGEIAKKVGVKSNEVSGTLNKLSKDFQILEKFRIKGCGQKTFVKIIDHIYVEKVIDKSFRRLGFILAKNLLSQEKWMKYSDIDKTKLNKLCKNYHLSENEAFNILVNSPSVDFETDSYGTSILKRKEK